MFTKSPGNFTANPIRTWIAVVTAVVLFMECKMATGNMPGDFDPRPVIQATIKALEAEHLSKKPINNAVSRDWLRTFIGRLDPDYMVFLSSDFEEFLRYEDRLDDLAKDGDFQFAELVRERYKQRVAEAVVYAEEYLAVEHDYSANESCPRRYDSYAANPEALRERWRLKLKLELLIEKLHGQPMKEVQAQLSSRYQLITRQGRDMSDERLCQIFLDSLAASFDPHSYFFSPAYLDSFSTNFKIRTYHLGLVIQQRAGRFIITSVHPSIPESSKLNKMIGWQIIAVGRLNGMKHDVVGMYLDDFQGMIRGASDYKVLESDTEILLELLNPITLDRVTMHWNRYAWR